MKGLCTRWQGPFAVASIGGMGKQGSRWRHNWVPLNWQAALSKAHGSPKGAAKIAAKSRIAGRPQNVAGASGWTWERRGAEYRGESRTRSATVSRRVSGWQATMSNGQSSSYFSSPASAKKWAERY